MRTATSSLVLVLTLALLTVLPSSYIGVNRAHAFNQTVASTNWLPFGPQSDQIIFSYYSDFQSMFTTFTTGGSNGIDITDWPIFPGDISTFCANADIFCGSSQDQLGVFDLQINHATSLLGVPQLQSRTTSPVSISV